MNTTRDDIRKEVFNVNNAGFEALALKVFLFQYKGNPLYNQYCKTLNILPGDVKHIQDIPFLPIQFFKSREITTTSVIPEIIFESSGTTGSVNSKHLIKDLSLYEESFLKSFRQFYGDISQYCIIGLLPSYLEKGNSSLVYMVNELIKRSGSPLSGFYLNEDGKLYHSLLLNEANGKKTMIIGVTYALLDFAEKYSTRLSHSIVIETGGMKGRRKELTREEVHTALKQRLGIPEVHSEYGMTELLSQAWSSKNGLFNCPPWMKILVRAEDDPFDISSNTMVREKFSTGVINIIDLANLYSCSFIATDDMGKLYSDGSFEVLGRMDNSDIRGCGLMIL
jgi:phenylacetate-coenzyme A ligase PaaK-like adenylate-forming protein